ncbi:D-cysteine desulfhydrase family protein [Rhizobiaceae bacterium n13]|uniref:D-cysteine desulfhydrase family protein n=1 Tax=Ferirhizobium litorale TaxID=2927786 RepID=A0AAE3QEN6_9HYPH|nr:D-cysteine desulfhydrase family protein [Fererhizobium litorale]MDI7865260.1 D-cysteine desulfhydrase family protein [Fererhizobium litorale]MDI7922130.1 D-cysteine desulfhydrase family protein [Fererhizobium litorale]
MPKTALLSRFPHTRLIEGPTPVQRLDRLESVLGARAKDITIWAKRDDLMGLGGGGNKLRKLEFLMGQAAAEGCDTLVAIGGVQSNFARLAAAACARSGLACELVLAQMVPRDMAIYQENGNVLLDRLFGARLHILAKGDDAGGFATRRASEMAATGRKVFVATLGGSTPVGCLGYVDCAVEIAMQSAELGVEFDQIVIPNGSGGMHAGLAAGMVVAGRDPSRIVAHTVLSPVDTCIATTVDKVNAVLQLMSREEQVGPPDLRISGGQLGGGYGIPTQEMVETVRLVGRSEGLLLDPVYGGKAFAGLLRDIEIGTIAPGSNVLFVMTGGSPGLYAYADALDN